MRTGMDALRMTGVGLDFPGRAGVLNDIHLRVAEGQVVVLEGRSGSGKSSILSVAAGLQPASRGVVEVMGERMDARDPTQAAALRARHVGLVFQHLHLLSELTVQENVELPLRLAHVPRLAARRRARELLQGFGLSPLAERWPSTLSGGEQQRVGIARGLALRPGLLLVDEPTSALDTQNAMQVYEAIRMAAAAGAAVVVATHDELLRTVGRVVQVTDGRVKGPA